jgi:hypothetical protein
MVSSRRAIVGTFNALVTLVVVLLLYFVLRRVGLAEIRAAIQKAPAAAVTAAVLLHMAAFVLNCFRWQQLMHPSERRRLLSLLPLYMAGVFGNLVTPGARVGGEPIRAYYMSAAFGGERSAHLGTILAEKLGNGAVFLVFLLFSLAFVVVFVPLATVFKVVMLVVVTGVPLVALSGFLLREHIGTRSALFRKLLSVLYDGAPLRLIRRRFATYQHFEDYVIRKFDNVLMPIGRAAGSPKALTKIVVISVAAWLVYCLAHYVVFRALGSQVGFAKIVIVVTISTFFGDASVSPGGVGFAEGAMIGLCAAFGLDHSVTVAATLISRGIYYVFGLGIGGGCLAVLMLKYGREVRD